MVYHFFNYNSWILQWKQLKCELLRYSSSNMVMVFFFEFSDFSLTYNEIGTAHPHYCFTSFKIVDDQIQWKFQKTVDITFPVDETLFTSFGTCSPAAVHRFNCYIVLEVYTPQVHKKLRIDNKNHIRLV